jgi:hypothetical protein
MQSAGRRDSTAETAADGRVRGAELSRGCRQRRPGVEEAPAERDARPPGWGVVAHQLVRSHRHGGVRVVPLAQAHGHHGALGAFAGGGGGGDDRLLLRWLLARRRGLLTAAPGSVALACAGLGPVAPGTVRGGPGVGRPGRGRRGWRLRRRTGPGRRRSRRRSTGDRPPRPDRSRRRSCSRRGGDRRSLFGGSSSSSRRTTRSGRSGDARSRPGNGRPGRRSGRRRRRFGRLRRGGFVALVGDAGDRDAAGDQHDGGRRQGQPHVRPAQLPVRQRNDPRSPSPMPAAGT